MGWGGCVEEGGRRCPRCLRPWGHGYVGWSSSLLHISLQLDSLPLRQPLPSQAAKRPVRNTQEGGEWPVMGRNVYVIQNAYACAHMRMPATSQMWMHETCGGTPRPTKCSQQEGTSSSTQGCICAAVHSTTYLRDVHPIESAWEEASDEAAGNVGETALYHHRA